MLPKFKLIYDNKIIVEKYDKTKKTKNDGGPFSPSRFADALDTNDNLGIVAASGDETVVEGTKVYFGNTSERIFIKGAEYYVMTKSNLIAQVEED